MTFVSRVQKVETELGTSKTASCQHVRHVHTYANQIARQNQGIIHTELYTLHTDTRVGIRAISCRVKMSIVPTRFRKFSCHCKHVWKSMGEVSWSDQAQSYPEQYIQLPISQSSWALPVRGSEVSSFSYKLHTFRFRMKSKIVEFPLHKT